MHLIIRDMTGQRHEGIVLAITPDCLRVTLQTREDTIELRLIEGQWTVEGEELVEIEALFTPASEAFLESSVSAPLDNPRTNMASAS